jgi:hypothetical protein
MYYLIFNLLFINYTLRFIGYFIINYVLNQDKFRSFVNHVLGLYYNEFFLKNTFEGCILIDN